MSGTIWNDIFCTGSAPTSGGEAYAPNDLNDWSPNPSTFSEGLDQLAERTVAVVNPNSIFYVDSVVGNDTNSGSRLSPVATVQAGINKILALSDAFISASLRINPNGTYNENIAITDTFSGFYAVISINSLIPGQKVNIGAAGNTHAITIANLSTKYGIYLTFNDISLTGTTAITGGVATVGSYNRYSMNLFFVDSSLSSVNASNQPTNLTITQVEDLSFKNSQVYGLLTLDTVGKFNVNGGSNSNFLATQPGNGGVPSSLTFISDGNKEAPLPGLNYRIIFFGTKTNDLINALGDVNNVTFTTINSGKDFDITIDNSVIGKSGETLIIPSNASLISYSSTILYDVVNNGNITVHETSFNGTVSGNPAQFKGMLTTAQRDVFQPNTYYVHSVSGDDSYKGSEIEPRATIQSIIDETIDLATEEVVTIYLMNNGNESLNFAGINLLNNKTYNIIGNQSKIFGCGSINVTNEVAFGLSVNLYNMRVTNTINAEMTLLSSAHIDLGFFNCNLSSSNNATFTGVRKLQLKDTNIDSDLILNNVGYAFFDQSSVARAGLNGCVITSDGNGLWNSNTSDQTTRIYVNGSRNGDISLLQNSNPFDTGYMSGVAPIFTTLNGGSIYMGANGEILFFDAVTIPLGMTLHCVGCFIKSDFINNGVLTLDSSSSKGVITGNTPLYRTATDNSHEFFKGSEFHVHPTKGNDQFLGSAASPKQTLQSAVDECYSLGFPDNYIYFDGEIDEEVIFGDATHQMNIHIFGKDKITSLWTNTVGGNIADISNNSLTNALHVHFHDFRTNKVIQARSDTQGSYVDLYLDNVDFDSSDVCDITALRYFTAEHCVFNCDLALTSCARIAFTDSEICSDPSVFCGFTYDDDIGSITHPDSTTNNFMTVDISGRTADLNNDGSGFNTGILASMIQLGNIVNTGEIYVKISAEVLFDSANTITIDPGVYFEVAGCKILADIVNDGNLTLNFATVPNGITGSGITVINPAPFIPTNDLDWGSSIPTTIEEALNTLAANATIP